MEINRKFLCTFALIMLSACSPDGRNTNSAPDIKDPGVLSLTEGQTSIVKLTATDADNDSITFSISAGVDKDLFTLNRTTGDLAFIEAADFEQPSDSDKDNKYKLTVTASDGKSDSSSDSVDLTVQITNAIEGRVVDGPMADSTLFIDLNNNGIQDENEPSGQTDAKGFFSINQPDTSGKLIAKGGTDTATGVTLSDFILAADMPQSSFASFVSVNPITTVLAQIPSDKLKAGFLSKIGIKDSYQTVLKTDYWAKAQAGDLEAIHAQRINQIIGLLMQTASSLQIYKVDSSLSLIVESLSEQDDINLANANTVLTLLKIAASDASTSLPDSKLIAVANSVATINAAFTNPDLNPADSTSIAIAAVAQQILQINIKKLVENEITVDKFDSENDAASLFSNISLPANATDTDNDNLADIIDPDDDNDGVLDINDAFPLDSSESMDTDGDGIGNNGDTDDDGDGVADSSDAFPLDPSESLDTDGDGIGNIADTDDDGDGVPDERDPFPLDDDKTPPTAVISNDKQSGSAPLIVNFDASNSIAGNDQNNIQSYLWDFADGVQESVQKTQRVYPSVGTYTAELTVVNNQGYEHSASVSIEVSEGQVSYPVSGAVSVDDNTDIDSDINDERSIIIPNGNFDDLMPFDSAQIIDSIPMQLTGYVNVPGEGHEGPLKQEGDFSDIFRFDALGGEVITLDIPHTSADNDSSELVPLLDLYLYNEIGELIDFSWNFGDTQLVINAPNARGTYFVEVYIFYDQEYQESKSSSDYKLTFDYSSTSIQATNTNVTKAADFVIGDIIVKRKSNCNSKQVNDLISSKMIRPLQQKGSRTGPNLYSFGDRIIEFSKSSAINKSSFTHISKGRSRPSEVELKVATLLAAREIAHLPCVEYAEPNYRRYKSLTPNDSQYNQQWHYEKINLPDAWDTTNGNEAIKVAVLDTGIALNHPDLLLKHSDDGYDFLSDPQFSGDGDGIDANPTDSCYDSHGTHVAGTVGATTDNSLGVAGVDWKARIMSVRVLGCYGGTDYDIAQGIHYAAGLPNDSGIEADPADIINMSLGGAGYNQTLADAVADAVDAGVIIIAAAGNESTPFPSYPAALEGVVSVAATDADNEKAWFSNFGPTIDVAAPGVDILSTVVKFEDNQVNHNYESWNGTSMAAPHVAGVASLMKSVYSDMTPDDFDAILISGNITDDLGDSGRDNDFGFGLINAKKAVEYAKQIGDGSIPVPATPILGLDYSYINFGLVNTEAVVNVSNVGSKNATLTISGVETANSFVTVTAPNSEDGLGDYTIRLDRTDLEPGIYDSSVKFTSDGGEKTLSIVFKVLDPDQRYYGTAGNIYLHLTNTDTDEVTKINVLEPVNGKYAFDFPHVAEGSYTLKAGNDLDNNGVLCEGAEGCGQFGGETETILEINADTTGVDFDLHY